MSLDKAIESGKEFRKPYRGSKAFDYSCRPHGGCPYCESNRLVKTSLMKQVSDEQIKELKYEC